MSTATQTIPQTTPTAKTRERVRLFEAQAAAANRVDEQNGVIFGVKVLGFQSRNPAKVAGIRGPAGEKPYRYLRSAIQAAIPMYEGVKVNIDHPDLAITPDGRKPTTKRTSDNRFGKLMNVRLTDDGLFADLHYLTSHPMAARVVEAATKPGMSDVFSLSHDAESYLDVDATGTAVVREIARVKYVDVIAEVPGTTRGLFESLDAEDEPEGDEALESEPHEPPAAPEEPAAANAPPDQTDPANQAATDQDAENVPAFDPRLKPTDLSSAIVHLKETLAAPGAVLNDHDKADLAGLVQLIQEMPDMAGLATTNVEPKPAAPVAETNPAPEKKPAATAESEAPTYDELAAEVAALRARLAELEKPAGTEEMADPAATADDEEKSASTPESAAAILKRERQAVQLLESHQLPVTSARIGLLAKTGDIELQAALCQSWKTPAAPAAGVPDQAPRSAGPKPVIESAEPEARPAQPAKPRHVTDKDIASMFSGRGLATPTPSAN